MSKSVFPKCDGCVARVEIDCEKCGGSSSIEVGGANISFPVTGFSLELEGNYQFLHTVNKFIYTYIFGDRVGLLTLSGIGFIAQPCNGKGPSDGLCDIWRYYLTNRIAAKKDGMSINLNGCMTMFAFLTGMRMEIMRPELPIMQWIMRFHVILPYSES